MIYLFLNTKHHDNKRDGEDTSQTQLRLIWLLTSSVNRRIILHVYLYLDDVTIYVSQSLNF